MDVGFNVTDCLTDTKEFKSSFANRKKTHSHTHTHTHTYTDKHMIIALKIN